MKTKVLFNFVLFVIMFYIFPTISYSQGSTKGKEFWLGFLTNHNGSKYLYVFFTSTENGVATITNPQNNYSQNVNITANTTTRVTVPTSYAASTPEVAENKGLKITSNVDINVFAGNYQDYTTDATIVLPVDFLGNEYYTVDYTGGSYPSQIMIISFKDSTKVTITPRVKTSGGKEAGIPFTVILNKGKSYLLRSSSNSANLSGSFISSTEKIAVFTGNRCANIPSGYNYCDHLYEQMYPVSSWGKTFVAIPLKTRTNTTYIIVASENDTKVKIGSNEVIVNKGSYYEVKLPNTTLINADKPIMVSQFSHGSTWDGTNSDPFMIVLTPVGMFINNISFEALNTGAINKHYLNILVPTECKYEIFLDGNNIGNQFIYLNDDLNLSYAQIEVSQGQHRLKSSDLTNCGFNASVYGYGKDDSYGYNFGISSSDYFSSDVKIQLTEETEKLISTEGFPVGTKFKISVKITETEAPFVQSVELYYRCMNNLDSSFKVVSMYKNEDVWNAEIPNIYSDFPGVQFYIKATDSILNYYLPSQSPEISPFNIAILSNKIPEIRISGDYILNSSTVNKPMKVLVTATDETIILDSVKLFYKYFGQKIFQKVRMNLTEVQNEYLAEIPTQFVTQNGIIFYCEAYDNYKTKSSTPEYELLYTSINSAPQLIQPKNNRLFNLADSFIIGFDWFDVTGASTYEIQVSETSSFYPIHYSNPNISQSQLNLNQNNLQSGKTYFWRVRARAGLNAGNWSQVRSFKTFIESPVVIYPENRQYCLNKNLSIIWDQDSNVVKYHLEISTDNSFADKILDTLTDKNFFEITNLLFNKEYFLRIKSIVEEDSSSWSPTISFQTKNGNPDLIYPDDELTNLDTNITFRWKSVEGAEFYSFQISKDSLFNDFIVEYEPEIIDTLIHIEGLEPHTKYFWRVKSNSYNCIGEWGEPFSFRTKSNIVKDWILSDNVLNFGKVKVGNSKSININISNQTNSELQITDIISDETEFSSSEASFTLPVNESKNLTITFIPTKVNSFKNALTINSLGKGSKKIQLLATSFNQSNPPELLLLTDNDYSGKTGVLPEKACNEEWFTYKVIYKDIDNDPPMDGYPMLGIDLNGDSDFDDFGEMYLPMNEEDGTDNNYSDGKVYVLNHQFIQNSKPGYQFRAKDKNGIESIRNNASVYKSGPELIQCQTNDLIINCYGITLSKTNPQPNEEIEISTTIFNSEPKEPYSNVRVRFYIGDTKIYEEIIPQINESNTINFAYSFSENGIKLLRCVIDELNEINESNEWNNVAIHPVLVGEYSLESGIDVKASLSPQKCYPNSNISVNGRADYVNTFDPTTDVSGGFVKATIIETGDEFTGYTNSYGNYNLRIVSPSNPGDYNLKVEITDFTLSGSVIIKISVKEPVIPCNLPDLAVRDCFNEYIYWTGDCVFSNQNFNSKVVVANRGSSNAENILVHFYLNNNNTPFKVEKITFLEAYKTKEFNFNLSQFVNDENCNCRGNLNLRVVVDPYNQIAECEEWNNSASKNKTIYVDKPDLVPLSADILPWKVYAKKEPYFDGTKSTFRIKLGNLNCTMAESSVLSVSIDGEYYDDFDVPQIAGFGTYQLNIPNLIFTTVGWHTITICIDSENNNDECCETNNCYTYGFWVHEALPDITVYCPDAGCFSIFPCISWDGQCIMVNENITVNSSVRNVGNYPAFDIKVNFYKDGNLIEQKNIESLFPNNSASFSHNISYSTTGNHSFGIKADPNDEIREFYNCNNTASKSREIFSNLPDLGFNFCGPFVWDIWYSNDSPCPNELIDIFIRVKNLNCADNSNEASTTYVDIYDVYKDIETKIGTLQINNLKSLESQVIKLSGKSFGQNVTGWHSIKAVIDPTNQVQESIESNNICSRGLFIDMPDLVVEKIDYDDLGIFNEPYMLGDILLQTEWFMNGEPYDKFCPSDNNGKKSYIGCPGSTLSQVLKYWEWPKMGVGNVGYLDGLIYRPSYGFLKGDFIVNYDYTKMDNNLKNKKYSEVSDDVPQLMYHAALSVYTDFGESNSGIYSLYLFDAEKAITNSLEKNFLYSHRGIYHRSNYSQDKWIEYIKKTLDKKQPIIYWGFREWPSKEGHIFTIDGYKYENDSLKFHFNMVNGTSPNLFWSFLDDREDTYFTENQGAIFGIRPKGRIMNNRTCIFNATIKNQGNCDAVQNFTVKFFVDGVLKDTKEVIGLKKGESEVVTSSKFSVPDNFNNGCPQLLVVVDEENAVPELEENNNSKDFCIGVDFVVNSYPYSNYKKVPVNTPVTIKTFVKNNCGFDAAHVPVVFHLMDNDNNPDNDDIRQQNVPMVDGYKSALVQETYSFSSPGRYIIKVIADSLIDNDDESLFEECSEDNNIEYFYIDVFSEPDLWANSKDIIISNINPEPNELVKLSGIVRNIGKHESGKFSVQFKVNTYLPWGQPITVDNILADGFSLIDSPIDFYSPYVGTSVIKFYTDIFNEVKEINEDNNIGTRTIIVGSSPNYTFGGDSIKLSNIFPKVGDKVNINSHIKNIGKKSGSAILELNLINDLDTNLIVRIPFSLDVNQDTTISYEWNVSQKWGIIFGKITNAVPYESNTFDNEASLEFGSRFETPLNILLNLTADSLDFGCQTQIITDISGGSGAYLIETKSNSGKHKSIDINPIVRPHISELFESTVEDGYSYNIAEIPIYVNPIRLVYPANNSNYIELSPEFKWDTLLCVKPVYHLQINLKEDFNSEEMIFDSLGIDSTILKLSEGILFQQTKYYWRVRAVYNADTSDWSSIWKFTTKSLVRIDVPEEWDFNFNTGNNALVIIPDTSNLYIDDRPFDDGDAIGFFFKRNDSLICAGYEKWNNENLSVTVWGDDDQTLFKDGFSVNEPYSVIIWDAQKGEQILADVQYTSGNSYYTIDGISIIGRIQANSVKNHKIPLTTGWNLISSYIIPELPDSIQNVCNEIYNNLVIAKNKIGQVFIPQYEINQIGNWKFREAYQLYLSVKDTLIITGKECKPASCPISLSLGWNWVAYLRNQPLDIYEAFETILDENELLIAKNSQGKVFIPSYDINQIGNLIPGAGYQVYSQSNTQLTYPENKLVKSSLHSLSPEPKYLIPILNNTGNSSVAILQINAPNGDEIGVYNQNDELVGSGVVHNGYASVTIWGDNDQTEETDGAKENYELRIKNYELKTGRLSDVIISNLVDFTNGEKLTGLNYKKDGVYFAKATVEKNESNISLNVRPNPASEIIEIELETPDCKASELKIYSLNGELIKDLTTKLTDSNYQKIKENIDNLTNGEYTIILTCGSERAMRKVVVVR